MSSWMFLPQFLLPNFLRFTLEVEMHGIERKGERRGEGLGGGEEEHTHEDLDHMVDKISVERLEYAPVSMHGQLTI